MKLKILGHEYDVIFDPEWGIKKGNPATLVLKLHKIFIDSTSKKTTQEEAIIH